MPTTSDAGVDTVAPNLPRPAGLHVPGRFLEPDHYS